MQTNLQKKDSVVALALRGQTVHWISARFCACMFLDSRDKYLNMFQKVSGFHLQDLGGFRVHILVT